MTTSPSDTGGTVLRTKDETTSINSKHKSKNKAPMCSVSELFSFLDSPQAKFFFILGSFGGVMNGLVYPAIAYIFSNSFSSLTSMSMHSIRSMGLRFVGLGAYAFVVGSIQNISFEITGKMVMRSFRLNWFQALLRQDAAFYDVYNVSGYAASMGASARIMDRGMGVKFGEGIQYIVTGFGGVAFALWQSWRVGLVILAVMPFLSFSALVVMKINQSQTASATKAYAQAGSVAYQTVSSIKTVLALNAIPVMIRSYTDATKEAYETAVGPLFKVGLANGMWIPSLSIFM